MVDNLLDAFSQYFRHICTHLGRNSKNHTVVTVGTERQTAIIHFQFRIPHSVLVIATWALNVVVLIILLLLFFFIVLSFCEQKVGIFGHLLENILLTSTQIVFYFFTFLLFNQLCCDDIHKHLPIVLPTLESQRSDYQITLTKLDRSQITQDTHHVGVLVLTVSTPPSLFSLFTVKHSPHFTTLKIISFINTLN